MAGESPQKVSVTVPSISLALIEPEIAGNVGAMLRTAACLAVDVHIVEPCGFAFADRSLRRAGMDYADGVAITRHADVAAFLAASADHRLILLTTDGDTMLHAMDFAVGDRLMLGSESKGAPATIHAAAARRVRIPIAPGMRSLNVGVAGAIALAEALRQTGGFAR